MRINQNIMAFNAYRNLTDTNNQLGKSLEKLSSGFRINRAADDAAGLVVSEGLRAQVSGLRVAVRNAQDGTSVVQTAEGALTEVHSMLRRMRDLTLQASNTGANDPDARAAAQAEILQLTKEIDRVATDTKFGQVQLLNGDYGVTNASHTGGSVVRADLDFSVAGNDAFDFEVTVGAGPAVNVTLNQDWSGLTTDAIANEIQGAIRTALDGAGQDGSVVNVTGVVDPADNANSIFTVEVTNGEDFQFALGSGGAAGGNTGAASLGFDLTLHEADGSGGLFQVGANANETISVAISSMRTTALGVFGANTSGLADANFVVNGTDQQRIDALGSLDEAIAQVSSLRGDLGAIQNRFEHTIANLSVTAENLAASESRIRDTDMALELVSFTRHQILQQAGTAMLAQANQVPSSVLSLLG